MEEKWWFGVYLKFFEISKELIKGKIVRLIEKRGRGFSKLVQEGVELCCESYNGEPISLKWKEGGRSLSWSSGATMWEDFCSVRYCHLRGRDFP